MSPTWLSVHAYSPQEVASRVLNDRSKIEEAIRTLNSIVIKSAGDYLATQHVICPIPSALTRLSFESLRIVLDLFEAAGWTVSWEEFAGTPPMLTLTPKEPDVETS